jgi:hypothetical protein
VAHRIPSGARNFRHERVAIHALAVLRSLALALLEAHRADASGDLQPLRT